MNKMMLSVLALAFVQTFAPMAMAVESVNKTLDADAKGEVKIEIVRGNITVTGWDKNQVSVEGTLDEKSEGLVFERKGDVIHVRDKLPNRIWNGDGSKLTIKVPRTGGVVINVVSTDVQITDIAGSAEIESVSGDIKASKLGHEVSIETVSGDVNLRGAGNELKLESVSGDLNVFVTTERLQAETVSGEITVRNEGVLKHANLTSVSGDVMIDSALSEDIDLSMEGVSSKLTMLLRGEVNARVEADTGPGGDVDNQLTNDQPEEEEFTGAESLDIKVGNGKGRIQASVVSGDIIFKKK